MSIVKTLVTEFTKFTSDDSTIGKEWEDEMREMYQEEMTEVRKKLAINMSKAKYYKKLRKSIQRQKVFDSELRELSTESL